MILRRPLSQRSLHLVISLLAGGLALSGCGAVANVPGDAGHEDAGTDAAPMPDAGPEDAGHDAAVDAAPDAAPPGNDGTAMHGACTGSFGSALTTVRGRLDGYLVSIVPPNGSFSCNGDSNHLHLQVRANGADYDIAVDIHSKKTPATPDVWFLAKDAPMPDGPWHEGWNTSNLSMEYVHSFGVHSDQFTSTPEAQLATELEAELATANHISVYATGYGPTGAHNVHRSGGGDGAIIIHPLSPTPHVLLFHFASQTF